MDYQGYSQTAVEAEGVGVGRRFVAILLDSIVFGIIYAIIDVILGSKQLTLTYGIGGIIYFLYFIIMEATTGATLGKMALGLRVVKLDGTPIGWPDSLVRNILRIIDVLQTAYLVGAILIWSTSRNQRLGDLAARTLVVKKS
ncbi:MAG TPA: RDD family protein [Ktedonobacteraceae bacterium]|nr:RDD family protein [Ktedonobacteraceae bacterium]